MDTHKVCTHRPWNSSQSVSRWKKRTPSNLRQCNRLGHGTFPVLEEHKVDMKGCDKQLQQPHCLSLPQFLQERGGGGKKQGSSILRSTDGMPFLLRAGRAFCCALLSRACTLSAYRSSQSSPWYT